jgi:hypothetical protein
MHTTKTRGMLKRRNVKPDWDLPLTIGLMCAALEARTASSQPLDAKYSCSLMFCKHADFDNINLNL